MMQNLPPTITTILRLNLSQVLRIRKTKENEYAVKVVVYPSLLISMIKLSKSHQIWRFVSSN